jgi:dienelactone hydrolase
MAHVLLFHHALGLTPGVLALAEELREAGHSVTAPDLFRGRVFADVEGGVEYAQEIGFDTVIERGVEAATHLPHELVYAGFSLGAMPAQQLAQQRSGCRGALLYHSAVPLGEFGDDWPAEVPLQMHIMADDPWDDLPVMEQLAAASGGELFVYDGDAHLFTDRTSPDYAPEAARLCLDRTRAFLAGLG